MIDQHFMEFSLEFSLEFSFVLNNVHILSTGQFFLNAFSFVFPEDNLHW